MTGTNDDTLQSRDDHLLDDEDVTDLTTTTTAMENVEEEEEEEATATMEEGNEEEEEDYEVPHWHQTMQQRIRDAPEISGLAETWNNISPMGDSAPPYIATMPAVAPTLSPEAATMLLTTLVNLWVPDPPTPLRLRVPFSYSLLNVPYDPYAPPTLTVVPDIEKAHNRLRTMLTALMINFESLSLPNHDPTFLTPPTPSCGMSGLQAFHKLSIALELAKDLILNDLRYRSLYLPQASSTLSAFCNPWETYIPNGEGLGSNATQPGGGGGGPSVGGRGRRHGRGGGGGGGGGDDMGGGAQDDFEAHQQVVLLVLRNLMKDGLVLMTGDEQVNVWQQIVSDTGFASHAWKPKMKLIDYVLNVIRPNNSWDTWKVQTRGRWTAKYIADHIAEQPFPQLPRMTMSRSTWSFCNGIYDGAANIFMEYETDTIPEDVVSCKYIDNEFDPAWTTMDLDDILKDGRQLSADKILQDQGFAPDERTTVFAMLGRMFFWTGQYDNWQSFPAFIGAAGTGKSSLLNQVVMFYPSQFVRQLSGKEATFGLETLQTAWIIIVYEITPQLATMFDSILSMAAGERVYIAKKQRQAEHVRIKAPFGMAGNQTFGRDTAGNMARRMLGVLFHKRIVSANTQMKTHQKQDMARFVVYAIRCYQNLVDLCKKKDVQQFLPAKFRETRREMVANINSLQSFVHRDGKVFRHPHNVRPMFQNADSGAKISLQGIPYLPWDAFMAMAVAHSTVRSLARPSFDEAVYSYIFDEYGLYHLKNVRYNWIKLPPYGRNGQQRPDSTSPPEPISLEGDVVLGLGLKEYAGLYENGTLAILSFEISIEA